MSESIRVSILLGSYSTSAYSRKIADYLIANIPAPYELQVLDISDLPLYNRDLDQLDPQPEAYTRLRDNVAKSDAIIYVTPEHNAGIPAVLKNAIDVCTRPAGTNLWEGKPTGIITLGAAMAGGQRVGDHLRNMCTAFGAPVLPLQTPLSQIFRAFDEDGQLSSPSVAKRLDSFIQSFVDFVPRHHGA
ncbi:MAG: NADPH-dependent FMN reductase [Rothia sp. (in: high G+C Gram-positive bacteria)]|uniref:NADPH-dependent FMN reductase n=1 Tax=Rothia sp. (in: high G+C Gram-positive bacteria) TaxID=1885016 RepID=UPI0026E0DE30|nr:NADPH-dependent FMN reductase [Rothia sp. (in: high G+C Gram-positive bacteria)]MDO5750061.1 NADPH-dependent FMN reductase [Rothia sp. (in: high G+C Gram-positive bacteria)]